MTSNPHLIRVFEIPPPDGRYCFGGGKSMTFTEVDWFKDSLEMWTEEMEWRETHSITTSQGRRALRAMIVEKNYFDSTKALLVLHSTHSFTINYAGTWTNG